MSSARLCSLGLLATALCLAQPQQDKDIYAIYSLLLTNAQTSHGPDANQRLLIVDTTVPGLPERPCLALNSLGQPRVAEIFKDFEERKDRPQKLKRELAVTKPYELLTESEAEQFRNSRAAPDSSARFSGVTDLFSFSNVYFDKAGTLAVVQLTSWCGTLCALFQWTMLEKQSDGSWKQAPGVSCSSIATRTKSESSRHQQPIRFL